jgi:hypothetical protein
MVKRMLVLLPLMFIAGCASYKPTEGIGKAEPPPIEVSYLSRQKNIDLYTHRDYYLKLKIWNPRKTTMWFVIRNEGDTALKEDGVFKGKKLASQQPFVGWLYDGSSRGGKGKVIRIDAMGQDRFTAFRLPPGASVSFERYHLISQKNFHEFELWEAPTILVNGARVLSKWLPYNTLSDTEVVLGENAVGKNLDWNAERKGSRQDYPKQDVEMVWVEAKRKHKIKLAY